MRGTRSQETRRSQSGSPTPKDSPPHTPPGARRSTTPPTLSPPTPCTPPLAQRDTDEWHDASPISLLVKTASRKGEFPPPCLTQNRKKDTNRRNSPPSESSRSTGRSTITEACPFINLLSGRLLLLLQLQLKPFPSAVNRTHLSAL